jgi:hypothetical protein
MAFVHGKNTYFSVNGVNLSPFTNTSELERNADSHDTTTYGQTGHTFEGGLTNGSFKASGIYDNTSAPTSAAGPHATFTSILGDVVELIRRTEGTGTGKPQETVDVLVVKYVETNPVADMVAWSAEMQPSGTVTDSTQ